MNAPGKPTEKKLRLAKSVKQAENFADKTAAAVWMKNYAAC